MGRRKRQHSEHNPKQSSCRDLNWEMIEKIEKHFSKLFCFVTPGTGDSAWCLPPATELYRSEKWTNESLAAHKQELNTVKSLLNDKDIVQWRQHTQNVNLAGRVVQQLRNKFHPELCTQAWCKFYEIVCSFPLVPYEPTLDCLNSVHLCEAPGAFVAALNHYLALNHPHINLSWLASTLNPYYEGNKVSATITDDRFILPTLANWDFGVDNTGNIFTKANRRHLIKRAETMRPVHLVTADGSIDCQNDPSEQEGTVAALHLAEVVTALQILSPGGNLVVKMFTCYEHSSVSLVYLLNCTFTSVKMFKPGTSKMGNSEVYVVALNYKGSDDIIDHLTVIEDHLDDDAMHGNALFGFDTIPESFMTQMVECCGYFKTLQIDAIQENLRLFETWNPAQGTSIESVKVLVASSFIQRFGVGAIPCESSIVGTRNLSKFCVQLKAWQVGSFNDRINDGQRPFSEKLAHLESCLLENLLQIGNVIKNSAILDPMASTKNVQMDLVTGKKFDTCFNSRFCQASILKLWHDLMGCVTSEPKVASLLTPVTIHEDLADSILDHFKSTGATFAFGSKVVPMDSSCASLATKLEQLCSPAQTCQVPVSNKLILTDLRCGPSHWHVEQRVGSVARYLREFCCAVEEFNKLCRSHQDSIDCCSLLFFINIPFTRVGAGVLYILHGAFQSVSLHTVSTMSLPIEILLCQNYVRPISTEIIEAIKLYAADENVTILEVVSIANLLEMPFCLPIHQFNCHALLHNMMFLIKALQRTPSGAGAVLPK